MKVAIIGSRTINNIDLGNYIKIIPCEIVSGGANGVDKLAKQYAVSSNIKYTEFLPEYRKFKLGAPLKRNIEIAKYADIVIAFWDGKSKGTKHIIEYCKTEKIPVEVFVL